MSTVKERIEVIKKKESKEGLNDWEEGFLANIGRISTYKGFKGLSERQEACLKKIEIKLGIDEEEEPEYPDDYRPLDEKPGFSIGTMSNLDDDIPF
jgi:hypothetical protein